MGDSTKRTNNARRPDNAPKNNIPKKNTPTKKKKLSKRGRARLRKRIIRLGIVIAIIIVVIVIIANLAKRGGGTGITMGPPDHTLFSLQEDGRVIYDEVTVLPSEYDANGVEDFARKQVGEYNKGDEEKVQLTYIETKDNKVSLRMEYKSLSDYNGFTGLEVYDGSITGAMAKGYGFEGTFKTPTGGRFLKDEVVSDHDAKVLIIQENTSVKVPGEIMYVSEEGTEVSNGEVRIASIDGNPDAAPLCYIIYKAKETN